jgi:twitching motility protein PilI
LDVGSPLEPLSPTAALSRGFALDTVAAQHSAAALFGDSSNQRQGFRVGDLYLMVRYVDGSQLTDMPAAYRLPNAPPWFLGVTNLDGTLIPMFDAAEFLGVSRAAEAKPMLLVLGHGEEKAGLVIDGLPTRLKPTAQDRLEQGAEPAALAGCITAVHRIDGIDWMDFRYTVLFDRLEEELAR